MRLYLFRIRHFSLRLYLMNSTPNPLQAKGKIPIFDRSWYGRVLVERVEAIANTTEWHRAYCEINQFEEMQLADDTRIVKIFMHISADEQLGL